MWPFFKKKSEVIQKVIPNNYKQKEPVVFESPELVSLVQDGVLDTSDRMVIAKYINNLKLLVEKAKQEGKINQFITIRNDEFFPHNWEWTINSKDTGIEKVGSNLSYELKREVAIDELGIAKNSPFGIPMPSDDKKINEKMTELDKHLGMAYVPVHFRSTKHFTVNTPLMYTGNYNNVTMGRAFTILDPIDNFLNSGYGYSVSYHDAYLDVSHEALPISQHAVVLISEDKYKELQSDTELMKELSERRLVVYRGDEAVAINMVLTEFGALPTRPGNRFMEYDMDTLELIDNSFKNLAEENHLLHDQSHFSLSGNGHFTSLLDDLNLDNAIAEQEYIQYLKEQLPDYSDKITSSFFHNPRLIEEIIKTVGHQRILEIINHYNVIMKKKATLNYEKYKLDRKRITPDISMLFKTTLSAIKEYYAHEIEYPIDKKEEIQKLMITFFQGGTVENQVAASQQLLNTFNVNLDIESNRII